MEALKAKKPGLLIGAGSSRGRLPAESTSNKILRTLSGWVVNVARKRTDTGLIFHEYELFIRGKEHRAYVLESAMQIGKNHPPIMWEQGQAITVQGNWKGEPEQSAIRIESIVPNTETVPLEVAQSLYKAPDPEQVDTLILWANQLSKPLKAFIVDVFRDKNTATAFATLPASIAHHHAHPGGLIAHSVECALICGQLATPWLKKMEAEVSMVGALLHDIGKTRIYNDPCSNKKQARCVAHEALTLEILAPALAKLEAQWPQGANLLRHILTWDKKQSLHPQFPGTLLVRMADQFSTATYCRAEAFADHPDWYTFARSERFGGQAFLRIPE